MDARFGMPPSRKSCEEPSRKGCEEPSRKNREEPSQKELRGAQAGRVAKSPCGKSCEEPRRKSREEPSRQEPRGTQAEELRRAQASAHKAPEVASVPPTHAAVRFPAHRAKIVDKTLVTVWLLYEQLVETLVTVDTVREA